MLLNIHTGKWDDEILECMGIPKSILPEIHDSSELYGHTDPLGFFGACIPISGSVVDQQTALFGQACFKEGTIKTTYGTGCFMLMNSGDKPAFSGLAAPHWDQYARGTMVGITSGTEKVHIVWAMLESMAYQAKDNLDVMEKDSGISIKVRRVDGGAVENEFLMQFQADILGIPVEVPVITDTTALGAAYLAAYGILTRRHVKQLRCPEIMYGICVHSG